MWSLWTRRKSCLRLEIDFQFSHRVPTLTELCRINCDLKVITVSLVSDIPNRTSETQQRDWLTQTNLRLQGSGKKIGLRYRHALGVRSVRGVCVPWGLYVGCVYLGVCTWGVCTMGYVHGVCTIVYTWGMCTISGHGVCTMVYTWGVYHVCTWGVYHVCTWGVYHGVCTWGVCTMGCVYHGVCIWGVYHGGLYHGVCTWGVYHGVYVGCVPWGLYMGCVYHGVCTWGVCTMGVCTMGSVHGVCTIGSVNGVCVPVDVRSVICLKNGCPSSSWPRPTAVTVSLFIPGCTWNNNSKWCSGMPKHS